MITLREVVQHYLEMNSYLQEALQQKDRDQLLETTVNICISIETQGAWLTVKSAFYGHRLKKWVKKTHMQWSLLDDGCNLAPK